MVDPTLPKETGQQTIAAGSSVTPVYTRRNMTMYALTESEVSTISSVNTQVSVDFALSSFLFSAALGVYTNSIFYNELNAAGSLAKYYAAPITFALGLVFLVRGVAGVRRRSKLWSGLKAESTIQ